MALQTAPSSPSLGVFRLGKFRTTISRAANWVSILSVGLSAAVYANAQTPQQQYVYASVPAATATTSEIASFSKSGGAGLLSPIVAPLADMREGGVMAVDTHGRFLFVLNPTSNGVSMFKIDPATGVPTEVSGSPFAVGTTENPMVTPSAPVCLATESSGQFLYVGYANGNFQGESAIVEYQIDAITPALVAPTTLGGSSDLPSAPVGMVTDPKGLFLYVSLGPNPGIQSSMTNVYPIGAQLPAIPIGTAGSEHMHERAIAIDPQGRFFFDGWGSSDGSIESARIDPSDGTASDIVSTVSLDVFPSAVLVESSGRFLYVQLAGGVAVYMIKSTGALVPTEASASTLRFQTGSAAADPQGPYVYSLQNDGIHAFTVDPEFGALFEAAGSPFSVAPGEGIGGLAVSGSPVQAESGPAASLFPASQGFGTTVVGQSSAPQIMNLTNTGTELITVNSVIVTGTNATDFTATPACQSGSPLPPESGASGTCPIVVSFTPTAAGLRQAILTTNDTAGVQSATLSGTGVAPQPGVTLIPGSVSFPDTAQGVTSAAQTLTVTSSGAATLHVSSVLLGGTNPSDFVLTNGCNGAYPVSASCGISVGFSPLGGGLRTATVLIADDAPGSPQSAELNGTGIGPPVARSGVTLSPSAVSFPATTLGTTVGSQTVTVTSTGNAPVQISSIILGGANPGDFKMTDSCTPPASYAVHASCVLTLIFTPSAAGTRTATITITDDAPNSPQIIGVTGSANAVLVVGAAAGGGLTATVSPGQTATYNLQLVPGFTGSVSLGCGGAPTAASCNVPAAMNVTSGVGVPFSVTVATTGTGALMLFSDTSRFKPQTLLPSATALALLAMVLIMFGLRRTQRTARSVRLVCGGALAGLGVMAMFAATGCGGGSTIAQSVPVTQPSVTATPVGTYTVTLTPTATSGNGSPLAAVPPTQLTLIVN
jgi:hypothetical protein